MVTRKVCLGAATLQPGGGGIARVARMCAKALIEAGEDVSIISLAADTLINEEIGAAKFCNGSKVSFVARIHAAALNHDRILYDSVGLARAHPRLPARRRNFVWMHGLEVWEGMRPDYGKALSRANAVFVNSHYTLERHCAHHGPLPSAEVCWLATEDDEPPKAVPTFSGPPTVLVVGRIEATEGFKGHAELLNCWPAVVSRVPQAKLLIAGGGSGLTALHECVRNSPRCGSIEVLGFVPEYEIPALFARSHVFAMPSRQEGFGVVYAEAMRYRLPIVASIHDAGQEINLHGKTGLNVDLHRTRDLPEALCGLLCNPDFARGLGEAGFHRWRQHFSYSRFAHRFMDLWHTQSAKGTFIDPSS